MASGSITNGDVDQDKIILKEVMSDLNQRSDDNLDENSPLVVIPYILRQFYPVGWFQASGGAMGMKYSNKIYFTSSGVQKERMTKDQIFIETLDGNPVFSPSNLKKSNWYKAFSNFFRTDDKINAVMHTHSKLAVMITLLYPGKEFRVSHHEVLKVIKKWSTGKAHMYRDDLVLPIVENEEEEQDIAGTLDIAWRDYPDASAILIRRHGLYVWGTSWQEVKIMSEALDYIFDIVIQMKLHGINPYEKHVPRQDAYMM